MANRPTNFKQIDVTRAAKGVIAAGLPVGRIEIDRNGNIVIVTKEPGNSGPGNDWD